MKAFLITAGVVLAVASCTRIFGSSERKTCDHMVKVCTNLTGLSAKDADECTDELPKLKDKFELDKATYNKFLSCAGDAENCAEVSGCVAGVATNVIDKFGKDMQRGIDKMQ